MANNKMDQEIIIKILDKTSIEEQIDVLNTFMPKLSREECLCKWVNKHYKNPLGDSIIFGAYLKNKLVGMNAYMPMEYTFHGETIKLLQSCDSKVLEECRGRGIWGKIVTNAVDYIFKNTDYACVIGFPNYSNSYPGFVKMKWQTVGHMKNYVMVNNVKALSKVLSNSNILIRCIAKVAGMQRIVVWVNKRKGIAVKECSNDSLFWDDSEEKMCVKHSPKWLEWKKVYKSIKTVVINDNGNPIASCIYSIGHYEGQQICKIEKFVTTDLSKRGEMRAWSSLLEYIKLNEPEVAFVRAWTTDSDNLDIICKKSLFIKSTHPNPFILKQRGEWFNDIKWNLSFWDLD